MTGLVLLGAGWLQLGCGGGYCAALAPPAPPPPSIAPAVAYVAITTQAGDAVTDPPIQSGGLPTTVAPAPGTTLPAGVTLAADGTLTFGATVPPGSYAVAVQFCNGTGCTTATAQVTVQPAVQVGLSYLAETFTDEAAIPTQLPTVTGLAPGQTVSYAVTGGQLPPGLTLNADGSISGIPTTPGVSTFAITLTIGDPTTVTTVVTYVVLPDGPSSLNYATPQTFTAGTAIAAQSPAPQNLIPGLPTSYAITGGALPGGLTLNADGSITGTPTTPGISTFTVTADNGELDPSETVQYIVTPAAPLALGYISPLLLIQGTAIATQTPNLGHPTPGLPTSYLLSGGALPHGLTFHADGTITGTPDTLGAATFTVTATNGARTATASPTYTVVVGILGVSYASPMNLTDHVPITTPLAPKLTYAGPGATTFTLSSGALPVGLTLHPDGTIDGTPTVVDTAGVTFTVTATNGIQQATTSPQYFVLDAPPAPSYPAFQATQGASAGFGPASNTGGTIEVVGVAIGSILPQGVTLDNVTPGNILLDGTTPVGSYSFQLVVANDGGSAVPDPLVTITVVSAGSGGGGGGSHVIPRPGTVQVPPSRPALPAAAPVPVPELSYAPASGNLLDALAVTPANTGGNVLGASIRSGFLPLGVTLAADGSFSGKPASVGIYTAEILAWNALGSTTSRAVVTITPLAAARAEATVLAEAPAIPAVPGPLPADPPAPGWQLNGAAELSGDGTRLQLTSAGPDQRGTAFWTTLVDARNLTVSFDAFMGGGTGGDGLSLIFADADRHMTPTALGDGAGRIPGVTCTLATAGAVPLVGITDGVLTAGNGGPVWLSTGTAVPDLRSCHHVTVAVRDSEATVTVDGTVVTRQRAPFPEHGYLGFGASTLQATDQHEAFNITVSCP